MNRKRLVNVRLTVEQVDYINEQISITKKHREHARTASRKNIDSKNFRGVYKKEPIEYIEILSNGDAQPFPPIETASNENLPSTTVLNQLTTIVNLPISASASPKRDIPQPTTLNPSASPTQNILTKFVVINP